MNTNKINIQNKNLASIENNESKNKSTKTVIIPNYKKLTPSNISDVTKGQHPPLNIVEANNTVISPVFIALNISSKNICEMVIDNKKSERSIQLASRLINRPKTSASDCESSHLKIIKEKDLDNYYSNFNSRKRA